MKNRPLSRGSLNEVHQNRVSTANSQDGQIQQLYEQLNETKKARKEVSLALHWKISYPIFTLFPQIYFRFKNIWVFFCLHFSTIHLSSILYVFTDFWQLLLSLKDRNQRLENKIKYLSDRIKGAKEELQREKSVSSPLSYIYQ